MDTSKSICGVPLLVILIGAARLGLARRDFAAVFPLGIFPSHFVAVFPSGFAAVDFPSDLLLGFSMGVGCFLATGGWGLDLLEVEG